MKGLRMQEKRPTHFGGDVIPNSSSAYNAPVVTFDKMKRQRLQRTKRGIYVIQCFVESSISNYRAH